MWTVTAGLPKIGLDEIASVLTLFLAAIRIFSSHPCNPRHPRLPNQARRFPPRIMESRKFGPKYCGHGKV